MHCAKTQYPLDQPDSRSRKREGDLIGFQVSESNP
jgi:hypothetical protein